MCIRLLILFIIVNFTAPAFAQAPGVAWQKLFSGSEGDYTNKVIVTDDGGSLVVGYTEFGGRDIRGYLGFSFSNDILVIKLRADGTLEWQRCLGGWSVDVGISAAETADGFLIFGYTASVDCQAIPHGGMDFYLAKMSKSGDIIWEKRYGGEKHEYGNAMAVDNSGNIYMVGNSESSGGYLTMNKGDRDCWIIKVSPTGNLIWQKSFGGSGDEGLSGICLTNDGAVMVVGYTQLVSGDFAGGKGKTDAVVARLSAASGNIEWIKLFGGSEFDQFSTVIQLHDNSILVGGMSVSKDGDLAGLATHPYGIDAWLININATGNINWKKIFAKEFDDHIQELILAPDGSVAGSGYRSLSPSDPCSLGYRGGIWIFRLSDDGNMIWEKIVPSDYNVGFASLDIGDDFSIVVGASASKTDIPGYYGNTSGSNSTVADIWVIKMQPESLTMPIFPPKFEIDESTAVICSGQPATIKTKTVNTGTRPIYRWKRNGTELPGIYSTSITAADFKDGDIISCTISSGIDCETGPFSITDQVTISYKTKTIQPVINISASNDVICGCADIRFTASVTNGGNKPSFHWRKNGNSVGYDLPEYITRELVNGDVITCEYSDNEACINGVGYVTSNAVVMKDNGSAQPASLTITASPQNPCAGSPVTLIAKPINAGINPVFEWKKNNQLLGLTNDTIILNDLKASDIIICVVKPDASSPCIQTGNATSNELNINFSLGLEPKVQLQTDSDTTCEGASITIRAIAEAAGTAPGYKWFLNGNPIGTNSETLVLNTINDFDQVSCRIYPDKSQTCILKDSVDAIPKILHVRQKLLITVGINEIKNNVCEGEAIEFAAVYTNAGTNPEINWYVNDVLKEEDKSNFTFYGGQQGDIVNFTLMPGTGSCHTDEFSSEPVTIIVRDTVAVRINPSDTTVKPQSIVQLRPELSGQIQSFQWSPSRLLGNSNDLNPRTVPLEDEALFRLTVINSTGCRSTAYAIINIAYSFYMPNAFTPNGDNVNDIFRIPRQSRAGIRQFSIYNRWGQLIFQTTNPASGWDGNTRGQAAPSGTYTYIIRGENEKGAVSHKGVFVLIR